jgi:predicted nucleotidyltransferase
MRDELQRTAAPVIHAVSPDVQDNQTPVRGPSALPEHRRIDGSVVDEGLRGADDENFVRVLGETLDVLDTAHVPFAFIGGIASTGFGRPRWTHDIDVFVRPEDAGRVLDLLAERGFRTERTDLRWIFKGWKSDVLVDVIFHSAGGFFLDHEMLDRAVRRDFKGHKVPLIPPEDLIIMKAVVHDEAGPRHWHDALGIIAGMPLDWDYFIRRAMRAPRRSLSLLVYAQSLDLNVPNRIIKFLFDVVYES